jgi:predicted acylesterase/phospholipase RssA
MGRHPKTFTTAGIRSVAKYQCLRLAMPSGTASRIAAGFFPKALRQSTPGTRKRTFATWGAHFEVSQIRLSGRGVVEGDEVVTWLRGLGVDGPIESYTKRYAAIATDLATGREVWLERGPIHEAVRASIALPGILSPTKIDEKWLVDGGLSNPVPVSVCRALGADVIIAVNLNGSAKSSNGFCGNGLRALAIFKSWRTRSTLCKTM